MQRGAEELYASYVQNGLTADMFSRYVRLNKIQALMKDGQLDFDLRWRRSMPSEHEMKTAVEKDIQ